MAQQKTDQTTNQPTPRRLPLRRKIGFSIVVVAGFFLTLEGALRLVGFESNPQVEVMEFTFPIDDYNENAPQPFLRRDPDLFWTPQPGVLGHNAQGFFGPEFSRKKRDGVFRIVCLGDSCTHFGPNPYPEILQGMLDQQHPGQFEVINAGVIGYTSLQGLRLLSKRVVDWEPDLVTVYFGWNDHWLARYFEDKDQTVEVPPVALLLLRRVRLFQFGSFLVGGLAPPRQPKMRVEPDDYRHNLLAMKQICDRIGSEMWLLTAPHALDLSIPPYLLTSGEVLDPDNLVSLHQSYNDIVRSVARQQAITIVDLEAEMDALDKRELFLDDHIHLTQFGRQYVAERMYLTLQQTGVLPQTDRGAAAGLPENR